MSALVIDALGLSRAALGAILARPPVLAEVRLFEHWPGAEGLLAGGVPDLVLCDARSEPLDGAALATQCASISPATAVILVADPGDEDVLVRALASPAAGFFTRDASVQDFTYGVQSVLAGHRALGASVMARVLKLLVDVPTAQPDPFARLSPTELEVLALVGEARTISAIAAIRNVSSKTVRNHMASIYRKLEVHGRTEAILYAARFGISTRELPARA